MSIENVIAFMDAAAANPALLVEVTEATSSGELEGTTAAIASLGKREGFDFTALEAAEFRGAVLQSISEGELDKSELDMVVGGGAQSINVPTETGQVSQVLATLAATQLAGRVVPIGGGIIGSGIGAGVGTLVSGGSASQAVASAAVAAAQNLNDTRSLVQKIFSGW